jgi:hypothetical protein
VFSWLGDEHYLGIHTDVPAAQSKAGQEEVGNMEHLEDDTANVGELA